MRPCAVSLWRHSQLWPHICLHTSLMLGGSLRRWELHGMSSLSQVQLQIDKINDFFSSGHSRKGCSLLSGPFLWSTSKAPLNLPQSHCGDTRGSAGRQQGGSREGPPGPHPKPSQQCCASRQEPAQQGLHDT